MRLKLASILLMLIGLTASAMAIFAVPLGLDVNADWGTGRRAILMGAIWAIAIGSLVFLRPAEFRRMLITTQMRLPPRSVLVAVCACCLFVFVTYWWFVTVGYWTTLPATSLQYDRLASSFMRGQLSLQEQPGTALAQLSNPYDCIQRGDTPVLWDASLYNGRYYLYFGPVPALLLAAAKLVVAQGIGDQYLVFGFVLGLFGFSVLLTISLWRRFFSHLPLWTLMLAILADGLIFPIPWLLSRPGAYEAALAGSQFFLIGGLWCGYMGLGGRGNSRRWWLLAGIFWGLAVGCRPTAAISVVFMLLLTGFWLLKWPVRPSSASSSASALGTVVLPLLVCAAVLGWYNYARFGTATEFGLTYQLTRMDMGRYRTLFVSPDYVLPNLQVYAFRPFRIIQRFPFLIPALEPEPVCAGPVLPPIYYSEGGTGLLFSAPYLILGVLAFASLLRWLPAQVSGHTNAASDGESRLLGWVCAALAGSALLTFCFLLGFFLSYMRYLMEVVPSLTLLASIGLWQGYETVRPRWQPRLFYSILAIGLATFSFVAGPLLAISGPEQRFRYLNHPLLQRLVEFFSR